MTSRPIDPAAVSQMQGGGMLKLTLLLVASLSIMSGATIAPSLPAIEAAYAGNPNAALLTRLVLTLPALFVALASPVVGRLGDRMGRTKLLIGALVLYAAAGSSGLYADSLPGLLIGRALLGIAVAGVMTLGTALAGDYFSGAERDRFMGLQQAFMGLGGLVFLTAAGYLADLDWRYPFVIYLFAAAILPLAARTLREPARHEAEAPGQGRASAVPAGSIAALCLLIFILSSTFYLIPAQLPFHMPKLGFDAPSEAGLAVALMTLFSATGSLSYGAIRRFASPFTVFAAGIVIAASPRHPGLRRVLPDHPDRRGADRPGYGPFHSQYSVAGDGSVAAFGARTGIGSHRGLPFHRSVRFALLEPAADRGMGL